MAVVAVKQFKGHRSGTVNGVHVPAGRAETAVAAEGDKFPFAAVWASIHRTAVGGVPTMNHFFYVFND